MPESLGGGRDLKASLAVPHLNQKYLTEPRGAAAASIATDQSSKKRRRNEWHNTWPQSTAPEIILEKVSSGETKTWKT